MLTPARFNELETLIERITSWAAREPEITAALIVGSVARGDARMDSDLDVVVLANGLISRASDNWVVRAVNESAPIIRDQLWGVVRERRIRRASGLEIEFNFAPEAWASIDPLDQGTAQVIRGGCLPIFDPDGLIGRLIDGAKNVR